MSILVDAVPALRVLIVDGDADTRDMYCDAFSSAGWYIAEASDGREAVVRVLTEKPSVIVTELRLPFISGLALCDILRRDPKTARLPILIVTSETRAVELAKAERVGANATLVKPASPDAMLLEMHRLVAFSASPIGSTSSLPAPAGRRTSLAKAYRPGATTSPLIQPANLVCPLCDRWLQYRKTYAGGVSHVHPEQWDIYTCASCGDFEYRHRTHKLRQC
jgi:CheY-like chemotaxis protein